MLQIQNLLFLLVSILFSVTTYSKIVILPKDIKTIGQKIWCNECAGTIEGLTCWKTGEDWASVGIGHFIWFPKKKTDRFIEGFPPLIEFMKKKKATIPEWLLTKEHKLIDCPWNSQKEFIADFSSIRMQNLRIFLEETIPLQTAFIVGRLDQWAKTNLPKEYSLKTKRHIKTQFNRMTKTPQGLYALIDYINFKGEGLSSGEQYHGNKWGLAQVLAAMKGEQKEKSALHDFANAAKQVLTERVNNAPPERHEERWLPGWKNRIDTYTKN
jgi:hypothetical protein